MSCSLPDPKLFLAAVLDKPVGTSMAEPQVTVVTVCLNPIRDGRLPVLQKNLDSVQRQEGVSLEHIIVDGASSDGTLDFLQDFRNERFPLRILSLPDSGIYEAMNRGIVLARGQYVIFLNSDDYYHRSDGLARSIEILDATGCGFSFAPIQLVGPHSRNSSHRHPYRHLHRFFMSCSIAHPSMLFRRDALMDVGGYDERYRLAADYDMMLRLIVCGYKACYVPHDFVSFMKGGFADSHKQLDLQERSSIVWNFHHKVFGIDLSPDEVYTLISRHCYPRRLLGLYKEVQCKVDETFVGLPHGLSMWATRSFNYWKYYLLCRYGS